MDDLFATAMPTPDTPLLHNDQPRSTEIRSADDAVAAALASYGAPPPMIIQAPVQPAMLPPPTVGLDTLNAMKPPAEAFTDNSHTRPGPLRRLIGLLSPKGEGWSAFR